eukprot:4545245-Pleurochrysis_carterae.AAC.5
MKASLLSCETSESCRSALFRGKKRRFGESRAASSHGTRGLSHLFASRDVAARGEAARAQGKEDEPIRFVEAKRRGGARWKRVQASDEPAGKAVRSPARGTIERACVKQRAAWRGEQEGQAQWICVPTKCRLDPRTCAREGLTGREERRVLRAKSVASCEWGAHLCGGDLGGDAPRGVVGARAHEHLEAAEGLAASAGGRAPPNRDGAALRVHPILQHLRRRSSRQLETDRLTGRPDIGSREEGYTAMYGILKPTEDGGIRRGGVQVEASKDVSRDRAHLREVHLSSRLSLGVANWHTSGGDGGKFGSGFPYASYSFLSLYAAAWEQRSETEKSATFRREAAPSRCEGHH